MELGYFACSTGVGFVFIAGLALTVKLILGLTVVVRARAEDLPKIVRGMAGWFYPSAALAAGRINVRAPVDRHASPKRNWHAVNPRVWSN
jgi:hypothetical protein